MFADEQALAMALIENIQREDLNPLEEAQAIKRLIDEFALCHFSHEQAAEAIGRSRSATSNLLRLLNLADQVQTGLLLAGDLDMGQAARALLARLHG
jgi:ParB family chromosome partitioning protein